jgi:hypothetical protein
LPLADAVALTFAAPLFLTALSWPGRARALDRGLGGLCRRPGHGAAEQCGQLGRHGLCLNLRAICNAVGTLTVPGLTRTESTASIVFYTALFMTLGSLPVLPFYWVTPGPLDLVLFCSIGLIGGISQYWTTQALYYAPAAAVSPLNYMR